MKFHTTVIVLMVVLTASGCLTPSNKTPPGLVCEVHNVPLQAGVAPVVYGLLNLDSDYLAAKKQNYPNSASFVIGGCSVEPEKARAVAFCPKCRESAPVVNDKIGSDGILELSGTPPLVEVEVQFIAYAASDVAALSKSGMIKAEALLDLHRQGKGTLVCSPKIVAPFGQEATVKAVEELIYPTDFGVSIVTNLPGKPENGMFGIVPVGFETREVGVVLQVTPTATVNPEVFKLDIAPEVVSEPTWRTYTAEYTDSSGKEHKVELPTPFFRTQKITTVITVREGETAICGGGMTSPDKKTVTYGFVRARLLRAQKQTGNKKETVEPSVRK